MDKLLESIGNASWDLVYGTSSNFNKFLTSVNNDLKDNNILERLQSITYNEKDHVFELKTNLNRNFTLSRTNMTQTEDGKWTFKETDEK